LISLSKDIASTIDRYLLSQQHQLSLYASKLADASPEKILARGFSMTLCGGRVLKDVAQCKVGDEIQTRLHRGSIVSKVIEHKK
jgi:exodeoxyribonuclease VII large subunit